MRRQDSTRFKLAAKLRPTAAALVAIIGALLVPDRLYGFVELFSFSNPANPKTGLVQGADGNFYGTTTGDGASGNGTVFRMTSDGTLTTLISFDGANGSNPVGNLIQGSDGNFYGTTSGGGTSGDGTIFKLTSDGILTTLISFNGSNGSPAGGGGPLSPPSAALIEGSDNFYGATARSGTDSWGSVFKVSPAGILTTLYSFTGGNDGSEPYAGLLQGSDGNFYGTTLYDNATTGPGYVGGTVFKITPDGVLTTLVSFTGANGNGPQAGLIQGRDGNFYGTTDSGGSRSGGSIFRIDSLANPPPQLTATTSSNQIIVSWPEDYPAFTLQTATNLNPPVNWLNATDSPVLLNGQFTVTNSFSSAKFYRLRY